MNTVPCHTRSSRTGALCAGMLLLTLLSPSTSLFAEDEIIESTGHWSRPNPSWQAKARESAKKASRSLKTRNFKATSALQLPPSWDSRTVGDGGWVTPVKNQSPFGTCWAFAAMATIETQLKKAGYGDVDLSEMNMANLHGYDHDAVNNGGNCYLSAAYLLRWGGAVLEANDPYRKSKTEWQDNPSHQLSPSIHVKELVFVPGRESVTNNDTLKEAIMEYGAVSVSFYVTGAKVQSGTGAAYCPYSKTPDHEVVLVGWDDTYPAANFADTPPGDGAWLAKNSWGTGSGDKGYLHVSYYDANLCASNDTGVVFIPALGENDNYDAVYGYDSLGDVGELELKDTEGNSKNPSLCAQFRANWNESLAAVGFYSYDLDDTVWDIKIYTNATDFAQMPLAKQLALSQQSTVHHLGYSTIRLEKEIPLKPGTVYSVVITRESDEGTLIPVCFADENACTQSFIPAKKRTFWRMPGSKIWQDSAEYADLPCNICLKAYTRSTATPADGDIPSPDSSGDTFVAQLSSYTGTEYMGWKWQYQTELARQASGTFGAIANLVCANGRSLWANWAFGLDPSIADSKFELGIEMTGSTPSLVWQPDLRPNRTYKIYGKETLSSENWLEVDDLATTPAHFFRLGAE